MITRRHFMTVAAGRVVTPFGAEAQSARKVSRLGLRVIEGDVKNSDDLEAAFRTLVRERAHVLAVASTPALVYHAQRVADFARKQRLPAISSSPRMSDAGLLLCYGTNWPDIFRRAADYIDRVLKGTRPADIPVEQSAKFEFIVNMKTAKTIGLTIPPSLLLRADQIIE